MKPILMLLASTLLALAAPPNAIAIDGKLWDAAESARMALTRTGGRDYDSMIHGTRRVPERAWIEIESQITIPFRQGLIGPEGHLTDWPMFLATKPVAWMVVVARAPNNPANYNANFTQNFANLSFNCNSNSGGLYWGGAQGSSLSNIEIVRCAPEKCALWIGQGSTGIALRDIVIENGLGHLENSDADGDGVNDNRRGIGIWFHETQGADCSNLAVQQARDIVIKDSYNVHIRGLRLEKVEFIRISGASNSITGIDAQMCGSTLLDFRGDRGGTLVSGRIRKTPGPVHYIDANGKRQLLCDGTAGEEGRIFEIRTSFPTVGQRKEWKAEVTLLN